MSVLFSLAAGVLLPFLISFALASLLESSQDKKATVLYGALSLLGLSLALVLLFQSFWGLLILPLSTLALFLYRRRSQGPRLIVEDRD